MINSIPLLAVFVVSHLWNDSCFSTITKTIRHGNCVADSVMNVCYRDELTLNINGNNKLQGAKVIYIKVEHECGGTILFDSTIVYVERKVDTTMTFNKICENTSEGSMYGRFIGRGLIGTAKCGRTRMKQLNINKTDCAGVGDLFGYSSVSLGISGNVGIYLVIENKTTRDSLNIDGNINYNYVNTYIKSDKYSVKVFENRIPRHLLR